MEFILLKELFNREKLSCPEWLSEEIIENYWRDSEYSLEEGIHKWRFIDEYHDNLITFDGDTYTFGSYSDGLFYPLEVITESEHVNI